MESYLHLETSFFYFFCFLPLGHPSSIGGGLRDSRPSKDCLGVRVVRSRTHISWYGAQSAKLPPRLTLPFSPQRNLFLPGCQLRLSSPLMLLVAVFKSSNFSQAGFGPSSAPVHRCEARDVHFKGPR